MEFDVLFPFKVPIKILKLYGLWNTKNLSRARIVYAFVVSVLSFGLYTTLQFIYLFTFDTFNDFVHLMSLLPTCIAMVFKIFNFLYNFSNFEELLSMIKEAVESETLSRSFENSLNQIDKIFKAYWASVVGTTLLAIFIPFFQHELPFRMWVPFDIVHNNFNFWCAVWYQIIDTCLGCGVLCVLDLFPVICMSYILGMLKQLSSKLEAIKSHEISQGDGKASRIVVSSEEFQKCINYHLKIVRIARKVEKIFSSILLAQGVISMVVLCTTSFALTIVSDLKTCLMLVYKCFMFKSLALCRVLVNCRFREACCFTNLGQFYKALPTFIMHFCFLFNILPNLFPFLLTGFPNRRIDIFHKADNLHDSNVVSSFPALLLRNGDHHHVRAVVIKLLSIGMA